MLDVGAKSTLRGKRLRRAFAPCAPQRAAWPQEWRDLLTAWVKQACGRRKWATLLAVAGGSRFQDAHDLMAALVSGGCAEVEEHRVAGRWQPAWITFVDIEMLHATLGLPDREAMLERWRAKSVQPLDDERLARALQSLAAVPVERALKRLELLRALDRWIAEQRFGTRRDFALFAGGDTKSLTTTEWHWLESHVDLSAIGIERHTPMLLLRAPLEFVVGERSVDLHATRDFASLTPATIRGMSEALGHIEHWRVVENRTSFERAAAKYGASDGVLWVPGFAPTWWTEVVGHLLRLRPAPALIACDPDPAGIEIAMQVAAIWRAAGLAWKPWEMDAETLARLQHRKRLVEADVVRLERLLASPLPEAYAKLARWMLTHREKGEQEGAI